MKKTVIAVITGLTLVSSAMAENVIVKTIDNKTYSVPAENAKAFEAEYNLFIKKRELETQAKAYNLREEILYNACIYDYFDSHPYTVSYSELYKKTVCTCFADKIITFEYSGPKEKVNLYWSSTVKYKQKQHEEAKKCMDQNKDLMWDY